MIEFKKKVDEAAGFIRSRLDREPAFGIVLGTGLGGVVDDMDRSAVLPYESIPHFPVSSAPGHHGRLVCGKLSGKPVIAMQGRFHLYEGYSALDISFPIRVFRSLGVKTLLISNAAGGLDPHLRAGDLMAVTDHINLTGHNPLTGPNLDDFGLRFPDMVEPYSRRLIGIAEETALAAGVRLEKGVYVGVLGPSLETAAETRFMRMIGGDAVGMSTVMEVITAVHCGMEVLGVSVITNVNLPDNYMPASIEYVIENAEKSGKVLAGLFEKVLERL